MFVFLPRVYCPQKNKLHSVTRVPLHRMEYTLKKSLGQHFLHDQAVCNDIVAALPNINLPVLEIRCIIYASTAYRHRWQYDPLL